MRTWGLLWVLGVGCAKTPVATPVEPVGWLPAPVADAPLGAPMAAVRSRHPALHLESSSMDFRFEHRETFDTGPVATAFAYFDRDAEGQPLYEWILEYRDVAARDAWIDARLGAPAEDGDWHVSAGTPWPVRAWRFDRTLVIAAAMPGTEYEGGF